AGLPRARPRRLPRPGGARPGALPGARRPRRPRRPGREDPGPGRGAAAVTVWDDLVGQGPVIARLQRAVAGDMTHAWLFTGPPASGRSNAALRFAGDLARDAGR